MSRTRTRIAAGTAAAVLLLAVAGCTDKAAEPFKDAPRGEMNNGRADVMTFPDGFSNVSAKCDGGNRVYVAYHGDSPYAALAVVADDSRCKGR